MSWLQHIFSAAQAALHCSMGSKLALIISANFAAAAASVAAAASALASKYSATDSGQGLETGLCGGQEQHPGRPSLVIPAGILDLSMFLAFLKKLRQCL